jgi:hypothetical protein
VDTFHALFEVMTMIALAQPVRAKNLPRLHNAAPSAAAAPLAPLLRAFAPIDLAEMDAVALQNRTDTKFLLTRGQLATALAALTDQYRVLEIDGVRLSPYETLYFDTPGFALYHQHHAGKANRLKVRARRYLVTGQAFFEVKRKTNKERTVKQRVPTAHLATSAAPAAELLAVTPLDPTTLAPRLWNRFSRLTLVATDRAERLTIDVGLRFAADGRQLALPGVAVAEVKQAGVGRDGGFLAAMHAAHIAPLGFSKYCIGAALLFPELKHNRFKPRLRRLAQLMETNDHDD